MITLVSSKKPGEGMSQETGFLLSILVDPSDEASKLVYADWLEDQADPRSDFLRAEIDRQRDEGEETGEATRLNELSPSLAPSWVTFITTLARPFRQSLAGREFFSAPQTELPFTEPIGLRGSIMTFQSQFRAQEAWDEHLIDDLHALAQLELSSYECAYGAASCEMYPFVCEIKDEGHSLTARDVLTALKARNFRSEHIPSLDVTSIPYPGYNPGTENDEIHNDFSHQYLFEGNAQDGPDAVEATSGAHGQLQGYVASGKLWYVVLHTEPHQHGEFMFSDYVILFAVGLSPHGRRLLGAVTHQMCHNLCD